ncbi:MAG TPA: exosortase-associated EpsI family protein [Verrucomicrobiae bacterium]|nr:exosortase-associated EpsI family protein [Verrucomicrobiae bacterium]
MKQNRIILIVALLMIAGAAWEIKGMSRHQTLTKPGIITSPIANSQRLEIYLPVHVLDYQSKAIPMEQAVLDKLPQDTSFGTRIYARSQDDFLLMNVVLMGTDRTSIHKPQICLPGQGWNIDNGHSSYETVRIEKPHPYDLQVNKLVCSRDVRTEGGNSAKQSCVFVYWFIADNDLAAGHWSLMRKMATHLLWTGELERWAYVYCMGVCPPGGEDETYARIKKFITAAVPQFQLAAGAPVGELAARQTAGSH